MTHYRRASHRRKGCTCNQRRNERGAGSELPAPLFGATSDGRRLFGGGRHRAVVAALGDARRLAGAAAQVIELGATHGALADDGDRIDVGRIKREDALDAFTERNLPARSEKRRCGNKRVSTCKNRWAP